MGFQVVCISRTLAAGGEVVGRTVSQRLGYQYVDEEIIAAAAAKAQVDVKAVEAAEHKQPFIQRLIESLADAHGAGDLGFTTGMPMQLYTHLDLPRPPVAEDYRSLIRSSIHEIATRGRAVIVAHAASMALAGMAGVLRVLITAPEETRARRLHEANPSQSEAQALAAIHNSDRERRDYFRLFYHVKEELPTHYDVVVNTEVLLPEQAVALILDLAQA